MIKKLSLIGAAIAATIAAAPSMALPVTGGTAVVDNTPGAVKLVVSGSSAFQSAFESELSNASSTICDNSTNTYTKYTATVTSGTAPGLFAYSCTSKAGLLASQKPLIIYYRTEGGSVYGLTPVVRASAKVLRLALNATNCSTTSGTAGTCAVGGAYTGSSDSLTSQTAAAVDSGTDLGLSDEEAGMFVGSNYPSPTAATKLNVAPLTSGLTSSEISTLNSNSTGLVLQSFGIYTHQTAGSPGGVAGEFNAVGSLSRQVIADIFRGKWFDWNQVPKNDGSNATVTSGSLPIYVCRREAGSGTQVAASVFFHNTNCGGTDDFVQGVLGLSGNLDPVTQINHATSTANMRTCLINNPGAIGFISAEADRAGLQMIKVDGKGAPVAGLAVATASGDYGFAFEVVAIKRVGLTGSDAGSVAGALITAAQDQAKGPTTPNVSFLPAGPNAGIAVFPLDTTTNPGKPPVSCFSRSGNSCAALADAC